MPAEPPEHRKNILALRIAFGEPDRAGSELVWSIPAAHPVGGRIRVFVNLGDERAAPVAHVDTDGMPGGDRRTVELGTDRDAAWLTAFVADRSWPGAVRGIAGLDGRANISNGFLDVDARPYEPRRSRSALSSQDCGT